VDENKRIFSGMEIALPTSPDMHGHSAPVDKVYRRTSSAPATGWQQERIFKMKTEPETLFAGALRLLAALCLMLGLSSPAGAGLIGQSVFGVLNFGTNTTNLFNPANIGLSQGALNELSNPVTITDGALEFSHVDNGVIGIFLSFRDDSMTFSTDATTSIVAPAMTISLTSAGFIGLTLTETSDNYADGGVNALLIGDTLTLNWAGTSTSAFYRSDFDLIESATAVQEPGALALLLLGLTVIGRTTRKRANRNT
jgi:hypothetical protein